MLETGCVHRLRVEQVDRQGAKMCLGEQFLSVSKKELPQGVKAGDELDLFVYRDGTGQLQATCKQPMAQVGEFALLRVRQLAGPGAFLDWGLSKDLLVPHAEQAEKMCEGRRYLVRVCLDSRDRVVASSRIEPWLEEENIDLQVGQEVHLTMWKFTDLGAKVIIDHRYGGLLFQDEVRPGFKRGDQVAGFVKNVRSDGKVDVTLSRGGAEGIAEAQDIILEALAETGFLPLHDQSSPAEIQHFLGMSKKTFKKAVGGLYKARQVEFSGKGIRLLES